MKITCLTFVITLLLLAASLLPASAQKLPGVQKISLRAPSSIKIDGRATEWTGGMQAYNRAIQARTL